MPFKMEALLSLHLFDDGRRFLSFKVSVYSMIGEIVHGVPGCKVIGGNAHYQAALLLVGCRQTNNIRGGIGNYNRNVNTAGSLGGSITGATAGNVAGRAGRLIKSGFKKI